MLNGRPTDALFLCWPLVVPPTPLALPPVEFFWFYYPTGSPGLDPEAVHLWSPGFCLEIGVWLALAASVLAGRRREPE